ncbi:chemotaxis-specific protein-glutamate methyltransferase CheB [Schlesneria paludicola]|uniref:chemotaxis-specific protein-glutamate methyltransferase CheB n=1 Tax=Schlesneria paludicola TaxID=360056 RepID=UPI00029A5322|nr:chemotaxis-specific protein-glutamate methyltransferase CheB [Schlesneria paludicola]
MDSFRVVVVDDSALFRTMLRNLLAEIPHCEVVASVADGKTAIDKITELRPDLVTLDVEMPDVSGIDVLRELKRRRVSAKVVMISRWTTAGAQVTTDALIEGAFDFILKPSSGDPVANKAALRAALEERISAVRETAPAENAANTDQTTSTPHPAVRVKAVVIGCSTGGPDALARVIPDLPANLPAPVFIVQHMPEGFTASLASRLNQASELEVLEAEDGLRVRPGQVVLARGDRHLELSHRAGDSVLVKLSEAPREHRCRPAVDFTLRSAVELYEGHLLAVILTGMGRDGTAGCELVHSRGGRVLAQHATGCTVYGMPKAVIQAGVADQIVELPRVAKAIERMLAIR